MLKQFFWKRRKILLGWRATILGRGSNYDAQSWWDKSFYTSGISDEQTICANKSQLSSMHHYRSVEMLILRHLHDRGVATEGKSVLDIGAGAGHWIEFWKQLGAASIDGADVSQQSVEHLRTKYAADDGVRIHHGPAHQVLADLEQSFNIVNAIGVMFHIVDDDEWSKTILAVAESLEAGGLLVVGGHFGWLNKINVQFDENGHINKRLRSKRYWFKTLRQAGFKACRVYRNRAYLHINDTQPENSVLIARKKN